VIPKYAEQQAQKHYDNAKEKAFDNPSPEYIYGCKGLVFGFKQHDLKLNPNVTDCQALQNSV
jgi:hypothetical protein